jgi:hypothetical protein
VWRPRRAGGDEEHLGRVLELLRIAHSAVIDYRNLTDEKRMPPNLTPDCQFLGCDPMTTPRSPCFLL